MKSVVNYRGHEIRLVKPRDATGQWHWSVAVGEAAFDGQSLMRTGAIANARRAVDKALKKPALDAGQPDCAITPPADTGTREP